MALLTYQIPQRQNFEYDGRMQYKQEHQNATIDNSFEADTNVDFGWYSVVATTIKLFST